MYRKHYSYFLDANPERLHFAAHSHHPWPNITREAHIQYWDDSAQQMDNKWGHIFGEVIPATQQQIAQLLDLSDPNNICFAPNTHEFIARLFSCFDQREPLSILTTDSEFHSFSRQLQRIDELENCSCNDSSNAAI